MQRKDFFYDQIMRSNYTNEEKKTITKNYQLIKNTKANILFLGRTGVGKSSTINALFNTNRAQISFVGPSTNRIAEYKLGNLILYDSPGFGESKAKDEENKKKVIELLQKKDNSGKGLIDMVIFIFDASSRDFGESIAFINEILTPILRDSKRLLIALNKIDIVDGGFYFNKRENKPERQLENRLSEKMNLIKRQLNKDYDVTYYCAGIEYDSFKIEPYNLKTLFVFILKNFSPEKRLIVKLNINENQQNFERDSYFWKDFGEGLGIGLGKGLLEGAAVVLSLVGIIGIGAQLWDDYSDTLKKGMKFYKMMDDMENKNKHSMFVNMTELCNCKNCENERIIGGINVVAELFKNLDSLYEN